MTVRTGYYFGHIIYAKWSEKTSKYNKKCLLWKLKLAFLKYTMTSKKKQKAGSAQVSYEINEIKEGKDSEVS